MATVSESNGTDYLVCLSDCKAGPALLRAVRRLSLAGSLLSRRLGDAMRFVARHVFKRVRAGHLLRKVAVFFKAGPTRDAGSISTTRLELSVLDITAVVITFTEDHNLPDALLVSGGLRLGRGPGVNAYLVGSESWSGEEFSRNWCICVWGRQVQG